MKKEEVGKAEERVWGAGVEKERALSEKWRARAFAVETVGATACVEAARSSIALRKGQPP